MLARAVCNLTHAFDCPLVVDVDVFFAHAQIGGAHLLVCVKAPVVVAARFWKVVGK